MTIRSRTVLAALLLLLAGRPAAAQTSEPAQAAQPTQPAQPAEPATSDPDRRVDPLQPDFSLAALPTTLRVPQGKGSFRVTHRFTRSLGRGDFGDLLSDFFGFDSGAQIGLEFRYGLLPGTQLGVHRTSDRTIQIFGQQSLLRQAPDGHPIGLDAIATLEGTNNLRGQRSSAIGLLVSRKVGRIAALYAEPIFVVNSSPFDEGDNDTLMLGLGGRVRVRPALYLVGEISPRLAGYDPGVSQASFGIEMRSGGHTFQINVSNGIGTTLAQVSRGAVDNNSWFIGFNIARKFF
ncbi:MAG TPA: DUF5777 family beta-barrel protein [Vicinamibacterales bacterium]|nr:DUF5777 family beta-barrel protein [Vicinamibacterales bacterium]